MRRRQAGMVEKDKEEGLGRRREARRGEEEDRSVWNLPPFLQLQVKSWIMRLRACSLPPLSPSSRAKGSWKEATWRTGSPLLCASPPSWLLLPKNLALL